MVQSYGYLMSAIMALLATCLLGCGPSTKTSALALQTPISMTNAVFPDGTSESIVQDTNGVSVCFKDHEVIVYFAIDSSISLSFDRHTRAVTNCILEKPTVGSVPGEYVFDFNGDGIPDTRRIKTDTENEVFYKGDWHRFRSLGNHKIISVSQDGKDVDLFFDGNKWREVGSPQGP